jgi:hypothetical protein
MNKLFRAGSSLAQPELTAKLNCRRPRKYTDPPLVLPKTFTKPIVLIHSIPEKNVVVPVPLTVMLTVLPPGGLNEFAIKRSLLDECVIGNAAVSGKPIYTCLCALVVPMVIGPAPERALMPTADFTFSVTFVPLVVFPPRMVTPLDEY